MTDLSRTHGFASQALGLLDGRFFRPPLPDGHVPRARLCQRLHAGLSGRLLLVNAYPGGRSDLWCAPGGGAEAVHLDGDQVGRLGQ